LNDEVGHGECLARILLLIQSGKITSAGNPSMPQQM
jgi:hypothetical protein